MISACVMLLVAGTGFGLKWQHINLINQSISSIYWFGKESISNAGPVYPGT